MSSHRSAGSKLERFSPKKWKKKITVKYQEEVYMHLGDGTNSCPIKLCRALSDNYPSITPQMKIPTIWIPVGKKNHILRAGGHLYTHRTRQTSHQQRAKLTGLYQQRIVKLLWNLVHSLCSVSPARKLHSDFQRDSGSQVSDAYYI